MWLLFSWRLVLVGFVWSIGVSVVSKVGQCSVRCLGLYVWIG